MFNRILTSVAAILKMWAVLKYFYGFTFCIVTNAHHDNYEKFGEFFAVHDLIIFLRRSLSPLH